MNIIVRNVGSNKLTAAATIAAAHDSRNNRNKNLMLRSFRLLATSSSSSVDSSNTKPK